MLDCNTLEEIGNSCKLENRGAGVVDVDVDVDVDVGANVVVVVGVVVDAAAGCNNSVIVVALTKRGG